MGKGSNRITIYTSSDFPYGLAPENIVRLMSMGFKENDTDVNVVLVHGHYHNKCNREVCFNIPYRCLLFHQRPKNDLFKFIELIAIVISLPFSILFDKFKNKTDVIIVYGIEYFYYNLPIILFSHLFRIKVIRIITDRYEIMTIVPKWWKLPKLLFYRMQYNYLDSKFDALICLSNKLRRTLEVTFPKFQNIFVIPHFISFNRVSNKVDTIDKNDFIVGYFGTLSKNNGILELLNSISYLLDTGIYLHLTLAGPIAPRDRVDINNYIEKLGSYVNYLGVLEHDEVNRHMLTCDVLINPRISGFFADAGFPTKIGEYFSTQKPIVATNVGDLSDYCIDMVQIVLVEPNSYEAIANGILFIMDDKVRAREIGMNGYSWGKENLDYIVNTRKLIKIIDELRK